MNEHPYNAPIFSECASFKAVLDVLAEAASALSFYSSSSGEESRKLKECRTLTLGCKRLLSGCLLALLRKNPNGMLIKEKTLASFAALSSCWENLPSYQSQQFFIRVTPHEVEASLHQLFLEPSAIAAAQKYEKQLLLELVGEP